jgi:hypothetical protein
VANQTTASTNIKNTSLSKLRGLTDRNVTLTIKVEEPTLNKETGKNEIDTFTVIEEPKKVKKKEDLHFAEKKTDEPLNKKDDAEEIGLGHIGGRKILSLEDNLSTKRFGTIKIINDEENEDNVQHSTRHEYQKRIENLRSKKQMEESVVKHVLSEIEEQEVTNKGIIHTSLGRRRLLDKFGDSLIRVNKLLNLRYGRVARKVPAHMPHMIRKSIIREVIDKIWKEEFDKTSSNRFRSSDDMQYAFSYFYYLIHEGKNYSAIEFFNSLDTNKDGILQGHEIRLLARIMDKEWKVPLKKINELKQNITLPNLSTKKEKEQEMLKKVNVNNSNKNINNAGSISGKNATGGTNDAVDQWKAWVHEQSAAAGSSWTFNEVDTAEAFKTFFAAVEGLLNATSIYLREKGYLTNLEGPDFQAFIKSGLSSIAKQNLHKKVNRYEYTLASLDQVAFHMLNDDYDRVADQLDSVRIKKPKFICLNDDMNQTNPNPKVKQLLHEFYEWYFPARSSFELPPNQQNVHLRVEKLSRVYIFERYIRFSVNILAILLMIAICVCIINIRKIARSKNLSPPSAISIIGVSRHQAYERDTIV